MLLLLVFFLLYGDFFSSSGFPKKTIVIFGGIACLFRLWTGIITCGIHVRIYLTRLLQHQTKLCQN